MSRSNAITGDWGKALARAVQLSCNRVEFRFTHEDSACGTRESLLLVDSASREGERYPVRIYSVADGATEARCTCPAGLNGRKCWHQAAALIRLGYLTYEPATLAA